MRRAQIIVFTAVALLITQLQCATACVIQACAADSASSQSVPPCHRHHNHSQDRMPASCNHQNASAAVVSSQVQPAAVPLFPMMVVPAISQPSLAAEMRSRELAISFASPPGVTCLSSVILRI
jgi:CDP-diacylglycerol pyrophosphatase